MNTNERKVQWAREQIEAGRTVRFATALRVTTFSPRTVRSMRASGVEPIKLGADGSVQIVEGFTDGRARYVDASYCRLSAV